MFYYPVQIEGLENLPAPNQPAVYVANHQSFLVSGRVCAASQCACLLDFAAAVPAAAFLSARVFCSACLAKCCSANSCSLLAWNHAAAISDLPAVHQHGFISFDCQPPQDIYTLFHLHRDFKFISKTSNFLIPIIGWSMFLTGASTQAGLCVVGQLPPCFSLEHQGTAAAAGVSCLPLDVAV